MTNPDGANDVRGPVALVIGAGDATGGAIAKRFAREGFAPPRSLGAVPSAAAHRVA